MSAARKAYRIACCLAVLGLLVLTGAFAVTHLAPPAQAAGVIAGQLSQCNNIDPSASGATTVETCDVIVVNTISGGTTSSTVTVTRVCGLAPCPSGNGTTTTTSTELVTHVNQCNNSDNDAAGPITCTITITNNISADTPGALPLTAATVNQCVGSGGGGGGNKNCDPFPATTTSATITQCNGSANGGGGTVACTVQAGSLVSPAIPVTVNQCGGSGNAGGVW